MGRFKDRRDSVIAMSDEAIYEDSLWKRFEGQKLDDSQISFLSFCMEQNLEHARHVENERLTFNSIYLAMAAAGLAVAGSCTHMLRFALFGFLSVMGILSMLLTARWNNAFNRHLHYAQQCYKMVHTSLFGNDIYNDKITVESIHGLSDTPAYAFRIRRPIGYTEFGDRIYKIRTNKLYIAFYWMIEIVLLGGTVYFGLQAFNII